MEEPAGASEQRNVKPMNAVEKYVRRRPASCTRVSAPCGLPLPVRGRTLEGILGHSSRYAVRATFQGSGPQRQRLFVSELPSPETTWHELP